MVLFSKIPTIKYELNEYSLELRLVNDTLNITMQLHEAPLSTKSLYSTTEILAQNLPDIFTNICYNDSNLTFYQESQNTEIGHLFEHILLENLTRSRGDKLRAPLQGKTKWNWEREPIGKFHIRLAPVISNRQQ